MSTKRVRLHGGKWITRTIRKSSPADLATAKPHEVWQSNDGPILVRDMESRHLINAIRLLERRAAAMMPAQLASDSATKAQPKGDSATKAQLLFPVYGTMINELAKRLRQTTKAQLTTRKIDLTP